MKLAQRKLDQLGRIKCHGAILNDNKGMQKLENQYKLARSLVEISVHDQEETKKKNDAAEQELRDMYEAAQQKCDDKDGDANKLYKKELRSLLYGMYNDFVKESSSLSKTDLVKRFEDCQWKHAMARNN